MNWRVASLGTWMLLLICLNPVSGYIDPGSGSMLFQLLFAFAVGGIIFFRKKVLSILAFFKRKLHRDR